MSVRIDELKTQLNHETDPRRKTDLLNELTIELLNSDLERSREYNLRASVLSKREGYSEGFSLAEYCNAMYLWKKGSNAAAVTRLKGLLTQVRDDQLDLLARVHNGLGVVHYYSGDQDEALNHYLTAMRLYEKCGSNDNVSGCLLNIGLLYLERKDFAQAMDYYKRSLDAVNETAENSRNAVALNQIGTIHMKLEHYPEALPFFSRSLELFRAQNHLSGVAGVLSNIAIVREEMGEREQAESAREEALEIYEKLGDYHGLLAACRNQAKLALDTGDAEKALKYLEKGLALAEKIDAKPLLGRIHQSMCEAYKLHGDFKAALEQFEKFHDINEQVFNEKSEEQVQRLTTEYDLEKARREAELHRLKNIELGRAQRIAQLGNWEWNSVTDIVTGSDEFYRILGLAPEENGVSLDRLAEVVFREDQFSLKAAYKLLKEGRRHVDIDFRVVRSGSEIRIVKLYASLDEELSRCDEPVFVGTLQDITERRRIEEEREKLTYDLQEALAKIRALGGLVPICSKCKKIRDDKGCWKQLEDYLSLHSELKFAHELCPECLHEVEIQQTKGLKAAD